MKIQPPDSLHVSCIGRRKFIMNTVKSAGGLALLSFQPLFDAETIPDKNIAMSIQQVMDLILKEGRLTRLTETVDTIKSGDVNQPVTGIVTTMFPTIKVIEETAGLKANFIIAHEPSFYNHRDDTSWVPGNSVLQEKQQLLQKHKIVIWRFHDYCHALKPDAISYGVAKKAGWLSYYNTGEFILTIPTVSLRNLAGHLKSSLGIDHLRTIGNPDQPCQRIALLPGAWGGQRQVSAVESQKPDVLIVGEVSEWETAEYIRDANLLGRMVSLIVLGHSVSEEPGMEWVAEWLRPKIREVKVTHIPSASPFTWM